MELQPQMVGEAGRGQERQQVHVVEGSILVQDCHGGAVQRVKIQPHVANNVAHGAAFEGHACSAALQVNGSAEQAMAVVPVQLPDSPAHHEAQQKVHLLLQVGDDVRPVAWWSAGHFGHDQAQ